MLLPLVAAQSAELLSGRYGIRALAQQGQAPCCSSEYRAGKSTSVVCTGRNGFAVNADPLMVSIVTLLGTALLAYCAINAPLELRLLIVFSMLLFGASLSRPLILGALPQWQLLATVRGHLFEGTTLWRWNREWGSKDIEPSDRPFTGAPASFERLARCCCQSALSLAQRLRLTKIRKPTSRGLVN
jgi:hypothetical protein